MKKSFALVLAVLMVFFTIGGGYSEDGEITGQQADPVQESEESMATGDKLVNLDDLKVSHDKNQGDISELESAIHDVSTASYKVIVTKGATSNTSGPLVPFVAKNGDSITAKATDDSTFGNVQLRFYDSEKAYINHWTLSSAYGKTRTFTYNKETDAAYVGVTTVDTSSPSDYLVLNNSNIYWQDILGLQNSVDAHYTEFKEFEDRACEKEIINRFNKETISEGKYINPTTGNLVTNDGFFASDFIYIGDLASVTVSYTHIFVWYDENKNHLTPNPDPMNSGSQDLTFTRPEGAVYLRFSAYNANLNSAQIGGAVSRNNYVPYGIYKLPELRINESQIEVSDDSRIIVDASGAGDYTSFTQAIYDNVDSGIDVLVKPGTYDIVAEYVALFGQSAVDSMADSDSAIFNGFQYGVRLRKRKVEFAPGAHLVCDWTGHTVDGTHRFSALGVDYDVEIIGLDLDVTATFYCIHDDYGISTPYTVKYENCRVIGHNIVNVNCIGGGCKKYSRHILENCYFDNNTNSSTAVRYHNTNADGAEPEIYVSNCYFGTYFRANYYGSQETKMSVYVNNCHAKRIYKGAESSSYTVDNVELYKWNNEETEPE